MDVLSGPFKIVLKALERRSGPDTLGDPTAARVRSELARLFQLDDDTASSIVSAMPIVILDGLDLRTASVVRDRLQVLRDAGCQVVVTDELTDTMPRVNWPQLPPIARVEPASDASREARSSTRPGELSCPHCGGGLLLVAAGASPPPGTGPSGREAAPEPAPTRETGEQELRETPREPARAASSRSDEDDWLNPPVGSGAVPASHAAPASAFAAPPPAAPPRRASGRFDDAALLAYRRPEAHAVDDARALGDAPERPAPASTTLGTATAEVLEVSFTDSSELEPGIAEQARRGALDAPVGARAPEPARRAEADAPRRGTSFDDLDDLGEPSLLDSDDGFPSAPPRAAAAARADLDEPSLLDSDDGFPSAPPRAAAAARAAAEARPAPRPSRQPDPFEDSLAGLDAVPPAPPRADRNKNPFASSPSRSGQTSRTGGNPFEDSRVIDDLSGLSGISAADLESGAGRDPLEDSGSDILDQPPPHRRKDEKSKRDDARFESDLELLDGTGDLGLSSPPPTSGRRASTSSSRDLLDDDDGLSLLDSDDDAPRRPLRKGSSRSAPDLDDVLNMFGPEDGAPLDDGAGLEPEPLDLSPPGARSTSKAGGRGERGFDADLSDILEPLDPGEALEIIKTSKPGRRPDVGGRGSRASAANGRHEEPSGLEQLDASEADALLAEARADRRSAKKSRGVPFPASDEDVGLFEESSRSGRPNKKKTDPFARARGRMEEAERRSGFDRPGADRLERAERGRPDPRESSAPPARSASAPKRGGAGPAPTGEGDHGLVLSRIADPDKKEQAAEIIAEVKGCSLEEARRLTDRTIIPVLKGVSREVAEFHLEKFKRVKIAGRVTTRQRG